MHSPDSQSGSFIGSQLEEEDSPVDEFSVALVHDYLNQRGGAERVVLTLSDIWPDAPIYTSLYRPDSTYPEFKSRSVLSSALNRVPVDKHFRLLFPLYGPAFAWRPPIDADVVIASSSGWAHYQRATPRALHVVYCHTPARWLIGHQRSSSSLAHHLLNPARPVLRSRDKTAALRADLYLANSQNVQEKIFAAYGIQAEVLHPPVDTARFQPRERGSRLLVVSRLLPYKRVDLVVDAARAFGIGLDIVGDGLEMARLQARGGADVTFHGSLSDAALLELIENCWAVCIPAEDDFGIVPLEANAAGKPVVAYRAGGALETVVPNVTGVFFDNQEPASLTEALRAVAKLETSPESLAAHAQRFSVAEFRRALKAKIAHHLGHSPPS